jgi:hypothetical protein
LASGNLKGRTTMGMETLNKAASAAGFAMAPPEDEPPATHDDVRVVRGGSQLPMLAPWHRPSTARDVLTAAAGWIRGHLPLTGGRAPA